MDSKKIKEIDASGFNVSPAISRIMKKMRELKKILNSKGTLDDPEKAFVAGYLTAGQSLGFIDQKVIRDMLEEEWKKGIDPEIAGAREHSDSKVKASEEKLTLNSGGPKRAGQPWSEEEKTRLVRDSNKGLSIEELAERHQRSEIAITYQLEASRANLSDQTNVPIDVAGQSEQSISEHRLSISSQKIDTLLSELSTKIEAPPGRLWKFGGSSWMQQVGNEHDRNLVKNAKFELTAEIRGLLLILRDRAETAEQRVICSRAKNWILENTEDLVTIARIFSKGRNESDIFARLAEIEKMHKG